MVPVTPTLPDQPAPLGRLIEATFRVWIASLRGCFSLALAPAVLSVLPALMVPAAEQPLDAPFVMFEWLQRPSVLAVYLLLVLFGVTCHAALLYRQACIGRGQDPGLAGSLQRGLQRLPAALGGWLLYALLVLVAMLPWLLVLGLVAHGLREGMAVLAALLSLPLLAPAIWAMLAAMFVLYAVVLERCPPWTALARSVRLIHGHWWRTSIVISVPILVYSAAFSVAGALAFGLAMGLAVGVGGLEALAGVGWLIVAQLLLAPLTALLTPMLYAGALVMFNDLVLMETLEKG